jgi:hypothetical protein
MAASKTTVKKSSTKKAFKMEASELKSELECVTYIKGNGHELMTIGDPKKLPFRFGKSKARKILEAINEKGGKAFVAELERLIG